MRSRPGGFAPAAGLLAVAAVVACVSTSGAGAEAWSGFSSPAASVFRSSTPSVFLRSSSPSVFSRSATTNLAPDPDFESDPSSAYFTNGPCTFAWSTEQAHSPTHSLKIASSTSSLCRWLSNTGSIPATAGTTYNASVYLKTVGVAPAGGAKLALLFYTGSTFSGASAESVPVFGTTDWTQASVQLTAPVGVTSIRLEVRLNGPGTVYADDMFLAAATGNPPSPPAVTIVSTVPSTLGASGSSTITWHGSANGSFSVRVSGSACSDGVQRGSGTYTTSPNDTTAQVNASDLDPGPNTIRICLTDSTGNTGSATTTVTKDLNAPAVTIVSASPGTVNAAGSSTLTWNASKNGTFSVRVGGTDCTTGTQIDSGTYSTSPANRTTNVAAASLAEGPNTVRVCVTDATANVGSAATSIAKDTVTPTVNIVSAVPSTVDGAPSSTVTWNASENGAFSVRVGGSGCTDGNQLSSGTYSSSPANTTATVNSSDLSPGPNTIRICVTDAGPNTGSATVTIQKVGGGGGSNLAPDSDLEQDPGPFYYPNGPCTFSWSTEQAHSPTHSLKIASTTASLCRWLSNTTGTTASAGTSYYASAYLKTVGVGPAGQMTVAISFWNSSGAYTGTTFQAPAVSGTHDWTLMSVQGTAPSGTRYVRLEFRLNGPGSLYADDATLLATNGVNDPPSFDLPASPDQTVVANAGSQSVPNFATNISPGPPDEAGQTVSFLVSNDNNALFTAQPAISPSGTLTYTPNAASSGSATVTVRAKDDGGTAGGGNDTSAPKTFTITTTPPNAAPVLANIEGTALAYSEGDPATAITSTLTVSDADSPNLAGATVSITSNLASGEDKLALASPPAGITPSYSDATGVLTLSGSASKADYQTALRAVTYRNTSSTPSTATRTISFQVDDGAAANHLSNVVTRDIQVTAADNPPTAVNDSATVLEDAAATPVAVLTNDTDPDGGPKSIASVTQPANGTVVITGGGTGLTYQPNANYCNDPPGTSLDTFTYTLNGGSIGTVSMTVTCVNDAPSFTKGADLTSISNASAYSQSGWATAISAGPANESGQAVDFVIDDVSDPSLFTVQPAVSATGTLTFTPDSTKAGTATVKLHLHDDGGTANGGTNVSPQQQFTIQTVFPPPVAVDDSYTATGNVSIDVSNTAEGVLQRGTDDTLNGGTLHGFGATSGTADGTVPNGTNTVTTSNGGTVKLASDGTFTYDPPPGYTGDDFFYYDLHNGGGDDVGQVKITIGDMIWFFDASSSVAGDGRLSSPFKATSSFVNDGSGNHGKDGQTLFLAAGTYTSGLALRNSQFLIGQGATADITTISGITLAPFSATLPSTSGTRPTLTTSSGNAITLGSGNTVRGLNVGNKAGSGISGSSFGTLTLSEMDITGSGQALDLATGTANATFGTLSSTSGTSGISLAGVSGTQSATAGALSGATGDELVVSGATADTLTYPGSITKTGSGNAVHISGKNGGTIALSGDITDTDGSSSGIALSGNTGATINFSGKIDLSTATHPAFAATGGGTVTATGSGSTLTTTTGTALDVENTTIGSSGLTFQSVSANGGSHGIVLDTTGSSGGLSVTGTGSANSGGTIQAISGADLASNNCGSVSTSGGPVGVGVYLNSTKSPSFAWMTFPGTFGNFGILGYSVNGFTLDNTTMTGTYGDNVNTDDDTVHFCTLTGSASITNSTISNGAETNLRVVNASGAVLNRLTMTNDTFGLNQVNGGGGVLLQAGTDPTTNTGTLNATVKDTTFQGSRGTPFDASTLPGTFMDLVFGAPGHPNTVHNTHSNIVSFTQDLIVAVEGTVTFDVNSNHFDTAAATQAQGGVLINSAFGTGSASGYFRNNTIGTSGVTDSGSSGDMPALDVESNGGGDLTIKVDNNQMYQWGAHGAGFLLQPGATGGNPVTFNATVTNNTIAQPGTFAVANNAQGFQLNNGTNSGENFTTCLGFSGNVFDTSGTGAGGDGRFRQRFDTKVDMPGYTGPQDGTSSSPTVSTFIQGLNPTGPPTITSVSSTAGGGGFFNTPGGAACTLPSF